MNNYLLGEVPKNFFDPDAWSAFEQLCGKEVHAIGALSPDPAAIVHVRQQSIEDRGSLAAKAKRDEHRYLEGAKLIATFREQLVSGTYAVTGASSAGVRVDIAPEICCDLEFDFKSNSTKNRQLTFTHVRVSRVGSHPRNGLIAMGSDGDDAPDASVRSSRGNDVVLSERCVAWLKEQAAGKSRVKKAKLFADAREAFGDELTTRAFNAAFKQVYGFGRGRPRRSER